MAARTMTVTTRPTATPRKASDRRRAADPQGRDLRIDFLRGVCLLFMLWNHVFWAAGQGMPFFLQFTALHWGLANAADGFVFLSGIVFGLVYGRVHERGGVRSVMGKTAVRVWQLYVANLVAMFLALTLVSLLISAGAVASEEFIAHLSLEDFVTPTAGVFARLATFRVVPWGFDVLPLYMLLLPLGALYIVLLRRSTAVVIALVAVLYCAAQLGINLPALKPWDGVWFFNPFAWQALFAIGILLGTRVIRVRRNAAWTTAAAVLVGGVAACVWLLPKVSRHIAGAQSVVFDFPLAGITNLEPVRLLYFLTLAYLIGSVTHARSPVWSRSWARPVALMGRHSLEVFLFGQVFTYATALVLVSADAGWPLVAGAALAGWGLSMLFAALVRARRTLA